MTNSINNKLPFLFLAGMIVQIMVSCQDPNAQEQKQNRELVQKPQTTDIQVVRVGSGEREKFDQIRADFMKRNPGYELEYFSGIQDWMLSFSAEALLFIKNLNLLNTATKVRNAVSMSNALFRHF